jgi:hypothetical protein
LAAIALLALAACARVRPLEGGPADVEAPRLGRIAPVDSSVGIPRQPVFELEFDEKLGPASRGALRFYPTVRHRDVHVDGSGMRVVVHDTLPADTTLILVIGETLQDEEPRNNAFKRETWLLYSTGPALRSAAVFGQVLTKRVAEPNGLVEYLPLLSDSIAPGDQSGSERSRPVAYPVAAADAEGLFRMLGIPPDKPFRLRAYQDRNANLRLDEGELAEVYADTLVLQHGEVRRGLQWNLIDPNEPARIEGVALQRLGLDAPLAVAVQAARDPADTTAADTLAAAPPDTTAPARADTLRPLPLPVPPRAASGWETAYQHLEPQGFRRGAWQVVYASPRGQYSVRVGAGWHRMLAFVDVSRDSVPGLHVTPDSTALAWEPLWVGEPFHVGPGDMFEARAIEIEAPASKP